MKVSRFLIVACCCCGATETASAFVLRSSTTARSRRRAGTTTTIDDHRHPISAMAAVDSSLMDPYSNPAIFLAGAGATFAAAIAAYRMNKIDESSSGGGKRRGGDGGGVEPPKVDLSIPYDAAAFVAYDAMIAAEEMSSSSSMTKGKKKVVVQFEAFRDLYEARTIAEVKVKARLRILNEDAMALRARLADVEDEIAGTTGDVGALIDEAEDYGVRIRELFR